LRKHVDDKLFNTNFFNKLQFWQVCASNERTRMFVPITKVYSSIETLEEMIARFDTVYVKPISGLKGIGVQMITRDTNNQLLVVNHRKEKKRFASVFDLKQYLD